VLVGDGGGDAGDADHWPLALAPAALTTGASGDGAGDGGDAGGGVRHFFARGRTW
jgi:hypothetical protein